MKTRALQICSLICLSASPLMGSDETGRIRFVKKKVACRQQPPVTSALTIALRSKINADTSSDSHSSSAYSASTGTYSSQECFESSDKRTCEDYSTASLKTIVSGADLPLVLIFFMMHKEFHEKNMGSFHPSTCDERLRTLAGCFNWLREEANFSQELLEFLQSVLRLQEEDFLADISDRFEDLKEQVRFFSAYLERPEVNKQGLLWEYYLSSSEKAYLRYRDRFLVDKNWSEVKAAARQAGLKVKRVIDAYSPPRKITFQKRDGTLKKIRGTDILCRIESSDPSIRPGLYEEFSIDEVPPLPEDAGYWALFQFLDQYYANRKVETKFKGARAAYDRAWLKDRYWVLAPRPSASL